MAKGTLGLLLAAACLGCTTTTSVTPLAGLTPRRPPLCPAAVRMFASASGVGANYTELAILSGRGLGWTEATGQRQLIASLRAKAAELGANGLIIGEFK